MRAASHAHAYYDRLGGKPLMSTGYAFVIAIFHDGDVLIFVVFFFLRRVHNITFIIIVIRGTVQYGSV